MFHVKHCAACFGETVIRHLELYMEQFGYRPPDPFCFQIEQFALALAQWGARTNLTARPQDPAEIAFHCADSLAPLMLAPVTPVLRGIFSQNSRALDLGTGAGFPGLILAAASGVPFVLLEARRKRASFLQVAAAAMGLNHVRTASGIADVKDEGFDIVTARAFGSPAATLLTAAAVLKPGGAVILYANPSQRTALPTIKTAGLGDPALVDYRLSRENGTIERLLAIWRRAPA